MKTIKLNMLSLPNQLLTYEDENNFYNIRLYIGKDDTILADVIINDINIISGAMVLPNTPIIPYKHMAIDGNFYISTNTDDIKIDYKEFGKTQFLHFGYFND